MSLFPKSINDLGNCLANLYTLAVGSNAGTVCFTGEDNNENALGKVSTAVGFAVFIECNVVGIKSVLGGFKTLCGADVNKLTSPYHILNVNVLFVCFIGAVVNILVCVFTEIDENVFAVNGQSLVGSAFINGL